MTARRGQPEEARRHVSRHPHWSHSELRSPVETNMWLSTLVTCTTVTCAPRPLGPQSNPLLTSPNLVMQVAFATMQ